ncbi:MAG: GntR family transcriptional regulator [Anaerolineae bacterium]|nr:GntR family transcriptional regulator [Anaerolineae bacterium]
MFTTYNRNLPKYQQLADLLRQQIASGKLQPNDRLPTEDELCETYRVSRGTIREAIRVLVDEGLIRREQGRGTFVNEPQPSSTLFTLNSFNEEIRRQNRAPSTRVLTAEITPAAPEVAGRLSIPEGEPVIHIARLRFADDHPVVYETRHLAQALCPTLLGENLTGDSIHWLLVYKYQIPLVKMMHVVEIRRLSAEQTGLLQAQPGSTAFFVDRLTFTEKNGAQCPAVWFQAIYHDNIYHIEATAHRTL